MIDAFFGLTLTLADVGSSEREEFLVGGERTRIVPDGNWRTYLKQDAEGVQHTFVRLADGNSNLSSSETPAHAHLSTTLRLKLSGLGPIEGLAATSENADLPVQSVVVRSLRSSEHDRAFGSPIHDARAIGQTSPDRGNRLAGANLRFRTDGDAVEMIRTRHWKGFDLTTGIPDQSFTQSCGVAFAPRNRGETRPSVSLSGYDPEGGQTREGIERVVQHTLDDAVIQSEGDGMRCDGPTANRRAQAAVQTPIQFIGRFAACGRRPHRLNLGSPANSYRRRSNNQSN